MFENSYSGPVTISPVKDFLICLKSYNFHTKLHQLWSGNSKKRTRRRASPRRTSRKKAASLWRWQPRCERLQLAGYLEHSRAASAKWRPFLGSTRQTNRACLRRDRGTSETAWQIWAWPPWRERKGANWIYIFVFNPPYTPHWLDSSSECRLHVCTYGNRRNTKNICESNIPVLSLGPVV